MGNIMKKSFSVSSIMIATILSASTSAQAAKLAGARGTMSNIQTAVDSTVLKAARLFEENNGEPLTGGYIKLDKTKNPYLKTLKITEDYAIQIQLAGTANTTIGSAKSPVAKSLLGAQILLMPSAGEN